MSLVTLSDIRIPPWLGLASERQMGKLFEVVGVVYLRVLKENPVVSLLGSKTKVAPVKTLSIPRLELCAAQLN